MYKLKNMGNYETLPEIVLHIHEGNTDALHAVLADGSWNIHNKIKLSQYTKLSLLEIALTMDQLEIVKLLIQHGVDLNEPGNPAFLLAVRNCEEKTVRYVYEQGARLDLLDHLKSNAYQQAYYGNKSNISLIDELGLDIRKYGGGTLRTAVSDRNYKIVEYMLKHGVDINYNEANMVYPYQATPLTVAVRNNDAKMAKYLIEHGADVTIAEKDGDRPYTIAVACKNNELAEYLKALEPPEFHDRGNKLYQLKSYNLPADLISFLSGENLRIHIPDNENGVNFIDFFSLTDTIEMKIGRKKLLRLSAELDNYSSVLIVWHPGSKKIGYYDEEHQEYAPLAKYADFMADPGKYVNKIFE